MPTFVKICGLCSGGDTEAVAARGPDAMGFVLWPGSKRAAVAADVAAWTRGLPAGILKVGVFVNATPDEVRMAVETAALDVAQLHGDEDPAAFAAAGVRLWKAVPQAAGRARFERAWPVEAVVLDSYVPGLRGGTGVAGDWPAARDLARALPVKVVLAGGLTPGNVREAIRVVGPWGVDVSSGVEARVGEKDLAKVKEFIEICRAE